jgi:capsular exopolysaccharide synthesis family protein
MSPQTPPDPESTDWLRTGAEEHQLQRYLGTIRERAWVIALSVLITVGATTAYLLTADKMYEAEADVLITPVPAEDTTLAGLGLLRDSFDQSRNLETAARLIVSRGVEKQVERELDVENPDARAEPVADSNIVTVTARSDDPEEARTLANSFTRVAIERRTEEFHQQLDQAIASVEARIAQLLESRIDQFPRGFSSRDSRGLLASELARLEALRSTDDPTMRLETPASVPTGAVSPKPVLSLIAALLAGLILGLGAAFALQLLDPRVRREEDLRRIYRLPVLGRIPRERGSGRDALSPEELSPATVDGFRTLRATLLAAQHRGDGGNSVLVTGASPSEGKTTVSINLASSLAMAGNTVILIEADLRRPSIGNALGVSPRPHGIVSVLLEQVELEYALVTPDGFGDRLHLLLVDQAGQWMADRLSLPAARRLVGEAKELADFVIIDSPPLVEVIDAMPLAERVDDVLVVVGLERSNRRKLKELGELLAQHAIRPIGCVLVGVARPRGDSYYYAAAQRERFSPEELANLPDWPPSKTVS